MTGGVSHVDSFDPKPVLDLSAASVAQLMDSYQHALEPVKAAMAAVLNAET